MRMIDKIMRSMRDTGLLEGMSDEDCDTLITAALEGMMTPTEEMYKAAWDAEVSCSYTESAHAWHAMINAALNE